MPWWTATPKTVSREQTAADPRRSSRPVGSSRPVRSPLYRLLSYALCACALACGGQHAALLRGQGYYEENQYERALAVWRTLERSEASLSRPDFARYAYLRGMTDYRLGFRPDARHWLALAKVTDQQYPGGLDPQWASRLDGALADLDREIFGIEPGGNDSVQSIEVPTTGASPLPAPSGSPPASPAAAPPPTETPPGGTSPQGLAPGGPSSGASSSGATGRGATPPGAPQPGHD